MQIISYGEALREAEKAGLDLMDVAPNARPPVFRLRNAQERAQAAKLREKEQRKKELENRKRTVGKEVRLKQGGHLVAFDLCYGSCLYCDIPDRILKQCTCQHKSCAQLMPKAALLTNSGAAHR
jgi:hypothetical protein